jgi:uncharacterized protein
VIADPIFYLAAIPAVLLNSLSKGGFGGAFGGIAVPLMASVVSPPQAAAIMLPLLCSADVFGMRRYYGRWDAAILRTMLIGGVAGVGFGALSFGSMSQGTLRLVVGLIAIAFSLYYFAANSCSRQRRPPAMRSGLAWASLSGYTSFVAHAGGPPAMAYLIPQGLERMVYVATINSFFMAMNLIKLVPYTLLGQFNMQTLTTSMALLPLVPVGVTAGFWLQRRINHQRFYHIAQGCLLASGIQLVIMSLR